MWEVVQLWNSPNLPSEEVIVTGLDPTDGQTHTVDLVYGDGAVLKLTPDVGGMYLLTIPGNDEWQLTMPGVRYTVTFNDGRRKSQCMIREVVSDDSGVLSTGMDT